MNADAFYDLLSSAAHAAGKLPKPEQAELRDIGGFRFAAVLMTDSEGRNFLQWELLGPGGWGTGARFGHWLK